VAYRLGVFHFAQLIPGPFDEDDPTPIDDASPGVTVKSVKSDARIRLGTRKGERRGTGWEARQEIERRARRIQNKTY
jgi:hypothetical protein